MKRLKFLTTTAFTLSMIAAGGIAAYAQSNTATTAEPVSAATMQQGHANAKAAHRSEGERHGKRGHQGGKHGGGKMMRALLDKADANDDGAVTQEEVDSYRAAKLAEVDASGDGALSIEEFDTLYREMTRSRMVDMFQKLDADGDGVITADEMDARAANIVERMDRDGDGVLSIKDRGRRG
jgi:Ca2+-binding EF-hand superfamily protein